MKKILAGIAVLAVAAVAQADLLASWNFTGSSGTQWGGEASIAAGYKDDNIASATLTPAALNNQYGTGKDQLRLNQAGWGAADADPKGYIGVSLSAKDNYTLTVNDIEMRVNGSGTGLNGTAVWTDANGVNISDSWTTQNATSYHPGNLTSQTGSTVDLRLVATLTGGNWGLTGVAPSGDNASLKINGFTTEQSGPTPPDPSGVPEPATMSLLGLGALAMVARKLRK